MSSRSTLSVSEARGSRASGRSSAMSGARSGWVTFAAVMLMIVGVLNFVYGIAAIDDAHFYGANTSYVVSDLNTWGWIIMLLGGVQIGASLSILTLGTWGRWVGIGTAGLNAIAQLMFIPSYPWLSIALFAVDVLVLYGLIARYEPDEPGLA